MKKQLAYVVVSLFVVAFFVEACATNPAYKSVSAYPTRGQSAEQVAKDKTECESWAQQETGYTGEVAVGVKEGAKDALIGGGIGAVLGVIFGAITGKTGTGAAVGATVGGGAGGIAGGLSAAKDARGKYERAYATCMKVRGYAVSD